MPSEATLHTEQRDQGEQEKLEQLEWDRLQREALAAQRYRLEQEIRQARKQGLLSMTGAGNTENHRSDSFFGIRWNYHWLLAGIVLLMIGGVIAGILHYP
ncbi:MAG: hypothetical protein CSA79_04755 [Thiothrix nivea]|nr:MAG: hypothetical protein CSA79_04755 [Thiothrix nivea]